MKKFLSLLLVLALVAAMCPMSVSAADDVITKVNIIKTDIEADGVFNEGGYGSPYIGGRYNGDGTSSHPQVALIDKTGKFVFDYRESYSTFHYDPDSGIVSWTPGSPYVDGDFYPVNYNEEAIAELIAKSHPIYYNLDGSVAFSLPPSGNTRYKAGPISEGLAIVMESTEAGGNVEYSAYVIDKNGEKVFDLPSDYSEWSIMDGDMVWKKQISGFSDGLALYYEYDWDEYIFSSVGYMDTAGKTVLDLSGRVSYAYGFHDGMARVSYDAKSGYINKSGELVIPFEYASGSDFSHGLASVVNDQIGWKVGFIDKTGKTVIPFEYDEYLNYKGAGDGLLTVVKNRKWGLINTNNEVVVPFEYDAISTYEYGAAYAMKDGYVYIITEDASGSVDVPVSVNQAVTVCAAVYDGSGRLVAAKTKDVGADAESVRFDFSSVTLPENCSGKAFFLDKNGSPVGEAVKLDVGG